MNADKMMKKYEFYYSLNPALREICLGLEKLYAVVYDALHARKYKRQREQDRERAAKLKALPSFWLGGD